MAAYDDYSSASTTASPSRAGHVRRRTRSNSNPGLLALPHRSASLAGLGFNTSSTIVERDDETCSSTSTASSSRRRESLDYNTYHSADTSVDYSEGWKQPSISTPNLQSSDIYELDETPKAAVFGQDTSEEQSGYLHALQPARRQSLYHDEYSPVSPMSPLTPADPSSSAPFIESSSPAFHFPRRSTIGAPYWTSHAFEHAPGLLSSPDIRMTVTPSPPQEYVASFASTSARGKQTAFHRKEPSLSSACFPASSSYPSSLSTASSARRPLSSKQAGKLRANDTSPSTGRSSASATGSISM